MEKLSDREILSIVDQEFLTAMGAPDGEISSERAKAWKYYNSEPMGNEVEGKSSFVTSDVSDVVNGIMPSLLRMFTTQENLISFDAVGPEDEELASQETKYTSHVFFKKNEDSFLTMFFWMFDSLTAKNGIVKCWYDEAETVTEESYTGLTEAEVFKLLEDKELKAVEREERIDETVIDGQAVEATVHDIKFKRTTKANKIRIEPVPPEEYRISNDSTSPNPSKARMVGQESDISRSDLLDMGFDADIVAKLPKTNTQYTNEEKNARRGLDEEREGAPDKSQELITVREAYIKLDLSGDGRSELRQVFTSNGHLLGNEPSDRQPFHALASMPLPHKHFGTCPAEMVMDIQRVTTTLTRQILDNLYQTNNPGHILYEQAIGEDTLDDFMSTEIGSIKRVTRPIGEAYMPQTVPFTAGATFPMLDHWDRTKRDRTGVQSDADGLNPEQLKHIQTSVLSAAVDQSKGKIEVIARIFAETGFKSLFRHIHELIRKHPNKAEVVKVSGNWIEVDPASWRDRADVTVNIGLGIGSRESNLIHLNAIKEMQAQMVSGGGLGLTVSPKNIYNTAAEIVKNANLKDPAMYFTDPGDAQAPPTPQKEQELQQMSAFLDQARADLEQREERLNKTMLQHQRETEKIAQDKIEHDDDVMLKLEALENQVTEMGLKYGERAQ